MQPAALALDRPGGQRRDARRSRRGCDLRLDLVLDVGDVALEVCSMFALTSSSAAALLVARRARSASRASSWIRVRTSSALSVGDLVAVAGHPLDRRPGAVAQRPDPADDRESCSSIRRRYS